MIIKALIKKDLIVDEDFSKVYFLEKNSKNKDFDFECFYENNKKKYNFYLYLKNECNENLRNLIGKLINFCEKEKIEKLLFSFESDEIFKKFENFFKILILTIKISNYSFEKYITEEKRKIIKIKECLIFINEENLLNKIEKEINEGIILADAINN